MDRTDRDGDMLEPLAKCAWLALAAVHAAPAAVLFAPSLVQSLYGVSPDGAAGVLLIHRGALFLALVVACVLAAFDPAARRVGSVVVAISVVGFLLVYARAGMPAGALRTIAHVDLAGLVPLAFVAYHAWGR